MISKSYLAAKNPGFPSFLHSTASGTYRTSHCPWSLGCEVELAANGGFHGMQPATMVEFHRELPSGKHTKNDGKSPFFDR
jgi:hypothetical protein